MRPCGQTVLLFNNILFELMLRITPAASAAWLGLWSMSVAAVEVTLDNTRLPLDTDGNTLLTGEVQVFDNHDRDGYWCVRCGYHILNKLIIHFFLIAIQTFWQGIMAFWRRRGGVAASGGACLATSLLTGGCGGGLARCWVSGPGVGTCTSRTGVAVVK